LGVLGVPVNRVLDQDAVLVGGIAHDRRGDALDLFRVEGGEGIDVLDDALARVRVDVGPAVAEDRPRHEREEGIVDRGAGFESRRIEIRQHRHGGVSSADVTHPSSRGRTQRGSCELAGRSGRRLKRRHD
jgi:hypothetical protein